MRGVYVHLGAVTTPWQQFMSLAWAISARELKGRYRRSLLGVVWALLPPLFYAGIFTMLQGVLRISTGDVPYVLFAYTGLVPWAFFVNAVTRCGSCIGGNAGILKKVAVPREVFPVTAVMTAIVDFGISGLLLAILLAWFGGGHGGEMIWLIPLVLLTALFALGVGFCIGALGTFVQDIVFGLPLLMQLWLLATPIMYPLDQVPSSWMAVYVLNPMVGIIEGFRHVLIQHQAPDLSLLGISLASTVLVWMMGWPLFRTLSQHFADAV